MQRFPSHRMPFPQWQPGMDPNGQMNQRRPAVQFPATTQGPRPRQQTAALSQSLLPYPKQSDNQGLQTMNNGNGLLKIRFQNNIISSHSKKKKVGSRKWTTIGGMVNKDAGLQEVFSQEAQAHDGQEMQAQQQQSSQVNQHQNFLRHQQRKLKIQRSNRLKTDSNPRMVPDQPQKISSSSNPAMQNNNNGHCMQNYSGGPSLQITKSHPTFQINNSGPFMHNDSGHSCITTVVHFSRKTVVKLRRTVVNLCRTITVVHLCRGRTKVSSCTTLVHPFKTTGANS